MDSDQKRLILIVAAVVLLTVLWLPAVNYVTRQLGYDPDARRQVPPPAPVVDQPGTADAFEPATRPGDAQPAGPILADAGVAATPVTLGSLDADGPFALAIDLVPEGAGVGRVVLNEFRRDVAEDDPYEFENVAAYDGDLTRPLTSVRVTLDGQPVDASGPWQLAASDAGSATYQTTALAEDRTPLARLSKTYRLTPKSEAGETGGYEVAVDFAAENLTDQPITLARTIAGPTTPPAELEDRPDRQILAGYFVDGDFALDQRIVQSLPETTDAFTLGSEVGPNPVFAWAGASTIYFQALVRPTPTAEQKAAGQLPQPFAAVRGSLLNPTEENLRKREVALTFETKPQAIAPGGSAELPLTVFFGPKQRSLMTNEYYAGPTLRLDESLVAPTGCTFCVFTPIVDLLNGLLRLFHFVTRDWGLAIIGLVLLVRGLLHPITKRSQVSMMKLGKLGPQLKKLQEKYGDDKEGYAKAAWQLQKSQGAGPLLGCLPMLLQTPIWIALYQSLQTTFELRHEPFFYGLTWIDDLSKPDHLVDFGGGFQLPCLFFPGPYISGLNLLPILLGVVFYVQMRMQPQPTAQMSPEQEQTQKLMRNVFPLIFPIFLYSAPSGLVLYILTSTAIGIVESKIVRDHIKQKDEEEKARGLVELDDLPLPEPKKPGKPAPNQPAEPRKGIGGFWQNLVEKAETMQAEVEKQKAIRDKQANKGKKRR